MSTPACLISGTLPFQHGVGRLASAPWAHCRPSLGQGHGRGGGREGGQQEPAGASPLEPLQALERVHGRCRGSACRRAARNRAATAKLRLLLLLHGTGRVHQRLGHQQQLRLAWKASRQRRHRCRAACRAAGQAGECKQVRRSSHLEKERWAAPKAYLCAGLQVRERVPVQQGPRQPPSADTACHMPHCNRSPSGSSTPHQECSSCREGLLRTHAATAQCQRPAEAPGPPCPARVSGCTSPPEASCCACACCCCCCTATAAASVDCCAASLNFLPILSWITWPTICAAAVAGETRAGRRVGR